MNDPTAYLVRKERKALTRYLKGEKATIIVQAKFEERHGLLAATKKRLVFVSKKWRAKFTELPVSRVQRLVQQGGHNPELQIITKDGTLRFRLPQRGAADAFIEAVRPTPPVRTGSSVQVRKGGPMVFQPKQAKPHPRQQGVHDPLASSKQQKLARLERLKQKGLIGAEEYRWQKDALER